MTDRPAVNTYDDDIAIYDALDYGRIARVYPGILADCLEGICVMYYRYGSTPTGFDFDNACRRMADVYAEHQKTLYNQLLGH